MDLNELRDFQVLVQRDFPSASTAHRALDAAAIELEKRLGGNMLGFQPSSTSSSSSLKSSPRIEEDDKKTKVQTKIRHDQQSASYISGTLPSSSLSVAVLGSGAIASLISAALGTNAKIKRLSMFSSWSERLAGIRKHGGIRFRMPLLHNSNIETVCSSVELFDLSELSRSSIGADAKALEDIVLSSSSSSSTRVVTPSHGKSRNGIDSSATGCFDLVLLCGKAFQVESQAALAALLVKPKAGLVVPLYNGADSFEYLSAVFSLLQSKGMDINPGQLLYGQTSLGARYERDEKGWILDHTGHGQTLVFDSSSDIGGQKSTVSCNNYINNKSGYNETSNLILSAMQIGPGDGLGAWPLQVLFKPHREMELARWRKVAVNSVLNPICALLGVTNGGFGEAAQGLYKKQVNALAAEAARAIEVNCEGSSVTSHEIIDLVHTVSKKTSFNTNSLLADLKAGREIEAPFINGAIVRSLFDKKREPAPANSAVLSALEARTVALFGEEHASKASTRALRIISNRRQTL
jgi:ketopantoate reductase